MQSLLVEAQRHYDIRCRASAGRVFSTDIERMKDESEIAEMERIVSALETAKNTIEVHNSTYPAQLLGMTCSYALVTTITTTVASFFSYVISTVQAAASGSSSILR